MNRRNWEVPSLQRQAAALAEEGSAARTFHGKRGVRLDVLQGYVDQSPRVQAGRLMLDATFGKAIQREQAPPGPATSDQAVARAGFSGAPAATFPHQAAIERSFGRPLPALAYTDEAASHASQSLNADAFAMGRQVAFASTNPDLELAAHEAAHVVQGTSGVRLPSGVGTFEAHADAVAARVAEGSSATDLLERGPVAPLEVRRGRNKGHMRERASKGMTDEAYAKDLAKKMSRLIAWAEWDRIRISAYPRASNAGRQRTKKRLDGRVQELGGLGASVAIDDFVRQMKEVQHKWANQSEDQRIAAITRVIDTALGRAGVCSLLRPVIPTEASYQGAFCRDDWDMEINQKLLEKPELTDRDAAMLSNTLLHEARHAEQVFRAARLAAGRPRELSREALQNEFRIPAAVAHVLKPTIGEAPPLQDLEFSQEMHKAWVTEGVKNQKITDEDYLKEMKQARKNAEAARRELLESPSQGTIEAALQAHQELADAIDEMKRRYLLYRNIPYEKDAHEVGDAAESAFMNLED